jgi:CBS domain-containing protein
MVDQQPSEGPGPAARRRELRAERLRSLLGADPPSLPRGSTIAQAIEAMRRDGGDSLLVTSGDGLAGIVTERDVLRRVLGRGVDLESPVDGLMDPAPETLTADHTLEDVLLLMERTGSRTVPLVDAERRVQGVIRQRDVLAFVAEAFPEEILNLPPRPHQVPETPEGG